MGIVGELFLFFLCVKYIKQGKFDLLIERSGKEIISKIICHRSFPNILDYDLVKQVFSWMSRLKSKLLLKENPCKIVRLRVFFIIN
jgi:hypothetical protein